MTIQTEPDYLPGDPLPQWLQTYVGFLKPAWHPGRYNWRYFESLNQNVVHATQVDLTDLGFIPIHTLHRCSHLVASGGESFLLFDCLQAATIRMLYYHVTIGAAQEQILEFLKEHIASCLLALGDDVKALVLLDEKIPFVFFNTMPKHPDFYFEVAQNSQQHLPKVPFTEAFHLIDVLKSCHETFHFLIHRGQDHTSSYLETAQKRFDAILDVVYPQTPPLSYVNMFRDIGIFKDDEIVDQQKFNYFFLDRRKKVSANRDSIIEEMACDHFAFQTSFIWLITAQQEGKLKGRQLEENFTSLYLISHLVRIIEQFTEKAEEIKAGYQLIDQENLSNSLHIRNVALYEVALTLVQESAQWPRQIRPINFWSREGRIVFRDIEERITGIKMFLDSFIEMPFSAALSQCVRAIRAKLSDEVLNQIYTSTSDSLQFAYKVHYTMPVIEKFAYADYFQM